MGIYDFHTLVAGSFVMSAGPAANSVLLASGSFALSFYFRRRKHQQEPNFVTNITGEGGRVRSELGVEEGEKYIESSGMEKVPNLVEIAPDIMISALVLLQK